MPCNARLIVVKKNASVLRKLLKDLKQIKGLWNKSDDHRRRRVRPGVRQHEQSEELGERGTKAYGDQRVDLRHPHSTAQGAIRRLHGDAVRQRVHRPQRRPIDLPRHYLLSLPRPDGYMGVSAFHDVDSPIPQGERTFANSNELARVRGLWGDTDEEREQELANAIDAYVLTGAIKLFREAAGLRAGKFRHHTMLVHQSRLKDDHSALAAQIRRLWRDAGYNGGSGLERLRTLYESDFRPVCLARAAELGTEADQIPAEFTDVLRYVGSAVAKVVEGVGNPVVVVNSDKDLDQGSVDFDLTRYGRSS